MTILTRIVTEDEADIRLDRWFRRHFSGATQGVIGKLCRTGQVRVDGHRAEPATRLAPGQSVRIPPLPAPPPQPAGAASALPPDPKLLRALEAMVLWRDAAADRAGQAARASRPRAVPAFPAISTACWKPGAPTGSVPAWCTGWTATPPA